MSILIPTAPLDGLNVFVDTTPQLSQQGSRLSKLLSRWGAQVAPVTPSFQGVVIILREFEAYARVTAPFPCSKNRLLARIIAQQLKLPWGWDWGWAGSAPTARIYGFTEEMAIPLAKGLFLWRSIAMSKGSDALDDLFKTVDQAEPEAKPPDSYQPEAEVPAVLSARAMAMIPAPQEPHPDLPQPQTTTSAPAPIPTKATEPSRQAPQPSRDVRLSCEIPARDFPARSGWPRHHTQHMTRFQPTTGGVKSFSQPPAPERKADNASTRPNHPAQPAKAQQPTPDQIARESSDAAEPANPPDGATSISQWKALSTTTFVTDPPRGRR